MQTQNLQLSNIVLKEQHYLPQKINPTFNFQLQPITHKDKINNNEPNQIKFHNKDVNTIRQKIERAQKLRKQLLLQKIAAKNNKYELRQKAQKQNKTIAEIKREQQSIIISNKGNHNQKSLNAIKNSEENYRVPLDKVKKIYVHNRNEINFSSTKGFVRNQNEIIQKIVYNKGSKNNIKRSESKEAKLMRVNNVKLPELNSFQIKNVGNLAGSDQDKGIQIEIDPHIKQQNEQKQPSLNPILKIIDVRYFGIQQRDEDFQKMGKSLLKQIKRKYWCYDSLQNEQIYENFQNMLNQQFM